MTLNDICYLAAYEELLSRDDILNNLFIRFVDGLRKFNHMSEFRNQLHSLTAFAGMFFFEPTDKRKAIKPLSGSHTITFASPNILELRAMAKFLKPNNKINRESEIDEILSLAAIVSNVVTQLIITRGSKGVMIIKRRNIVKDTSHTPTAQLDVQMYSDDILHSIENVSGAGDCFASGYLHGILLGLDESSPVSIGFQAAKEALVSKSNVPLKFNISSHQDIKCKESWIYSQEK